MSALLTARPPKDPAEERAVRKLAASRHAPGDWIQRARMITHSWQGLRTSQIAAALYCHPRPSASAASGSTPRAGRAW